MPGLSKLSQRTLCLPLYTQVSSAGVMRHALSESAVYFFQETRSTYAGQITVYALRRVSKAGGNVETIDVGEIPSGKLSVRGDHVVFTDINSVYSITP